MKKFDVFLSHSSQDKSWTKQLASSLKKQGLAVWIDNEQIRPGEDVVKAIQNGIAKSNVVVTVVDPKKASQADQFFEAGMAVALGKENAFVVPKETKNLGLAGFDISNEMVVLRTTPASTARQLVERKKLAKFRDTKF
jgi:nucleoside 2-deoxyribosyltransferase